MEPILDKLASSVAQANSLETLVRPILELLESITGIESTYLTTVDEVQGLQQIIFSRNCLKLEIPEGLTVPWSDTLCKRALEEGRYYTNDVSTHWGDSEAARQLGIVTYVSQPIHASNGALYGTLCAASHSKVEIVPTTIKILDLFANIIAYQVDRELLLDKLRQRNLQLLEQATTDPLTGLMNRRVLIAELNVLLRQAQRREETLVVAFLDLDGFKKINDDYGHNFGDEFLIEIARRLRTILRAGDLVARYGGDEFVVGSIGARIDSLRERLERATTGTFTVFDCEIDYSGPSIGFAVSNPDEYDPEAILIRADFAMYKAKQARRYRHAG